MESLLYHGKYLWKFNEFDECLLFYVILVVCLAVGCQKYLILAGICLKMDKIWMNS